MRKMKAPFDRKKARDLCSKLGISQAIITHLTQSGDVIIIKKKVSFNTTKTDMELAITVTEQQIISNKISKERARKKMERLLKTDSDVKQSELPLLPASPSDNEATSVGYTLAGYIEIVEGAIKNFKVDAEKYLEAKEYSEVNNLNITIATLENVLVGLKVIKPSPSGSMHLTLDKKSVGVQRIGLTESDLPITNDISAIRIHNASIINIIEDNKEANPRLAAIAQTQFEIAHMITEKLFNTTA